MAELHVRNLPPELHEQLRERARAQGRSMSTEAIASLRYALGSTAGQPAERQAAIEGLNEIRRRTRLPTGGPASEQLVREDRDQSR